MKTQKDIDKFWDELWFIHVKNLDKGVDLVAKTFDECFTEGNFDIVDKALWIGSDYRNFATEIHVAILAFSFCAKEKLPNRLKYITMCEELFKKRHPDRWERLLKNVGKP